jgi:hypothetical protein
MVVVNEKRGSKDVPHYFHTLTEKDGSKKRIYLGSDAYEARKRIIHLQGARLKDDQLFRDADALKHKLSKIAEHGRPIEAKLQDVKQTYYAHKQYDAMLEPKRTRRLQAATAVILSVGAVGLLYALFDNPTITGFSVLDSGVDLNTALTTPLAGGVITILLVALVGATALHAKYRIKKNKLEKYLR